MCSEHASCSTARSEERWAENCDTIVLESPQQVPNHVSPLAPNDQQTSSQLFPLVFSPIFSLLRIAGLPVPLLCNHSPVKETFLTNPASNGRSVTRSGSEASLGGVSPQPFATDVVRKLDESSTTWRSPASLTDAKRADQQARLSRSPPGKATDPISATRSRSLKSCPGDSKATPLCTTCRWKFQATKVLGVLIACTLVANAARYVTVFFKVTGSIVTSIVMMIFWLISIAVYLQLYYSFSRHFPQLLKLLRSYDDWIGTCLDCRSIHSRIKTLVLGSFLSAIVTAVFITVSATALFPSFHQHLAPFDEQQGIPLYIASGMFALFLCFLGTKELVLESFLYVMTIFASEEFGNVAHQLHDLLDRGYKSASKPFRKSDNENEGKRKRKPTKSCFYFRKKKLSSSKNISDSSAHAKWRTSALQHFDVTQKRPRARMGEETEENCQRENEILFAADNARSSTGKEVKDGRQQWGDYPALEQKFDQLVTRHEFLCEIVKQSVKCMSHNLAYVFIMGVPVICIVVYGLASGSIQWDECLFLSLIVSHILFKLFLTIRASIIIADNAHAPAVIMYSANWPALSDRLLLKMQIFCSRLANEKIGYDVYGLFMIDRSTVLMMVGTIVTYSLVVIQFQQSESSCYGAGIAAENTSSAS